MSAPIVAFADRARRMPESVVERLDAASVAVVTLDREADRLRRLGLDAAADRCRTERRYWNFVRALHDIATRRERVSPWEGLA